jgi:hypothetical protein
MATGAGIQNPRSKIQSFEFKIQDPKLLIVIPEIGSGLISRFFTPV